jgi:fructokinase
MRPFGGIEAGGTKFVCAVGSGPDDIISETRFPTTSPAETIGRAIEFFRGGPPLAALGIASFGPVDPALDSPTWGYITATPKPGWADVDLAGALGRALGVRVGFDTDVNGAALAEWRWGAGAGLDTLIYLTIGTGIGGGGLANGALMHGLMHPEMGHIRIPHDPADAFPGACPYHGDCLEGLAAGPALAARWGRPAHELPPDHPAWRLEAHYLALGLVSFVCTVSPERIIMGGGIMDQSELWAPLRDEVRTLLAGYIRASALEHLDKYIIPPALGRRAGVLGAIALAQARQ